MKIEKTECSYQVTECDLKFGEQITLDGELLISADVLDEIRAEIDGAEMPKNRMCFFRDGIDCALRIIDKYNGGK